MKLKVGDLVRTKTCEDIEKIESECSTSFVGPMRYQCNRVGRVTMVEHDARGGLVYRIKFSENESTWWWNEKWCVQLSRLNWEDIC